MKQVTQVSFAFVLLIILVIGALCLSAQRTKEDDVSNSLHWLPDESHFVDYCIDGDSVIFRYSICFVNNSEHDTGVKISAKFSTKELEGWVRDDGFFEGCSENGEWEYQNIKSGEKKNFVFSFKGKYLGGVVNQNLSFPEDLLVSQTNESGS